jgi:hypothetical protein
MPEVGVGLGLERFTLVTQGDVYCVIDIVDEEAATIVLTALPDFPLDIKADRARQFVEAWQQREKLQGQPYEVRPEQREL